MQNNEYCEICQTHGHPPRLCPILQKYSSAPNTLYCSFCGSSTHSTDRCRALDALADRLDRTTFRVNETPQGLGRGQGGGVRGDFRGGRIGEEDQVDDTTLMSKAIWLEIVLIRGSHGALTVEPMGMQLKTA